jgi:RNA polymerase sigma-70 factor (ECF subfamily)
MNSTKVDYVNDEQLVASLKNGDMDSFGKLYKKYFSRIYQSCYGYCRNHDDACDLAHDILLKAFRRIHTFAGHSSLSTWLFSITRNHCISHISKSKRMIFEEVGHATDQPSDDLSQEEFEERLRKEQLMGELGNSLNQLAEPERRLLELKYGSNYSVKDLQDTFGLSSSAVKMRLMRSRQKVGSALLKIPA